MAGCRAADRLRIRQIPGDACAPGNFRDLVACGRRAPGRRGGKRAGATPPAMSRLRALAFNLVFWIGTVFFGIAGLPFLLTPRRVAMRFGRFWAQAMLFALKWIVGLDGDIRGRENIPRGACLIAMKHQSMWDTLMLPPLLGDPAVVIKSELRWVPFYGWY